MDTVPGRNKRLESAISLCILAVITLISAVILIKQIPPRHTQDQHSKLTFLASAGFTAPSKTQHYNADNLYEKIDGKAPQYTESGFVTLKTQRFETKNGDWAELYVYDMGRPRNAFSVYSIQKRLDSNPVPRIKIAYRTENAIFCVFGKYYVEFLGYAVSDELFDAMISIVRKLQADLNTGETARLEEIDLFPAEYLIPGSVRFYISDAFGFEGFSDTFVCTYKIDDRDITAFLSKTAGPEQANVLASSYTAFLTENGAARRSASNDSFKDKVFDFYETTEIVFSTGPFVAGVHEAPDQKTAEMVAMALLQKLTQTSGSTDARK